MSNPKDHAHELIERLPPSQLTAVVGLLEASPPRRRSSGS